MAAKVRGGNGGGDRRQRARLRYNNRTLRQMYLSLTEAALLTLRDAFLLDLEATSSALTQAFCRQRLALIASVLEEKQHRREVRHKER